MRLHYFCSLLGPNVHSCRYNYHILKKTCLYTTQDSVLSLISGVGAAGLAGMAGLYYWLAVRAGGWDGRGQLAAAAGALVSRLQQHVKAVVKM